MEHAAIAAQRMLRALDWDVRDVRGGREFDVSSDPVERVHLVSWPSAKGLEPGDLDADLGPLLTYVHMLARALLAERVHPLFSTPAFSSDSEHRLVPGVLPVARASADWFAEHLVFAQLPGIKGEAVRTEMQMAASLAAAGVKGDNLRQAMVAAQAEGYLGMNPQGYRPELARVFLSVPPGSPSVFTLQALGDLLASLTAGSRLRIEGETWRVSPP